MYDDLFEQLTYAAFHEWYKDEEKKPNWQDIPPEAQAHFRRIAMAVLQQLASSFFAYLSPGQLYDLLSEIQLEEKKGGKAND